MSCEFGLNAYSQGSGGIGRHKVAPNQQLCCDRVETMTPKCFRCQSTESFIIVGVNLLSIRAEALIDPVNFLYQNGVNSAGWSF